jgi:hypothetical protein
MSMHPTPGTITRKVRWSQSILIASMSLPFQNVSRETLLDQQ